MEKRLVVSVWLVIILGMLLPEGAIAQNKIKFERVTLEQNTIYCILQDRKGFLWFGTEEGGLYRYDGYKYETFNNEQNDVTTVSNNLIRTMCEGDNDTMWIGTEAGLNLFNRKTGKFKRYLKDSSEKGKLKCDTIKALYPGKEGILWIGTNEGGLYKFNTKTEEISCYIPPTSNYITCILEDSTGKLWIGTEKGLFTFNPQKETFQKVDIREKYKENCNEYITTLDEDETKTLRIGTFYGDLLRWNKARNKFVNEIYDTKIIPCEKNQPLTVIFKDHTGTLWIGTYGGGLYAREKNNVTFVNYRRRIGVPNTLTNNFIYTMYEDKSGVIWIGTEGGLNKMDTGKNRFIHWGPEPDNPKSLKDNYVWAIYKDKEHNMWVGTNIGLHQFDKEKGEFINYPPEPGSTAETSTDNKVVCIIEDSRHTLWVGTQGGGLRIFDRKKKQFTGKYENINEEADSIADNCIISLREDHRGELWVGTQSGLDRLNRAKGNFIHFLSGQLIQVIYEDSQGILWIGTNRGLNAFGLEGKTSITYRNDPEKTNSLSYDFVYCIREDHNGNLWIGTYNGLNRYDPKTKTFYRYWKNADGLPSNTINGILEDKEGFLWISTGNGLSRFDPRTGIAKNYDERDGLQGNEFNPGAYFYAPDTGEMFFGGTNGFNSFFPNKIRTNIHKPAVVITDFQIYTHSIVGNKSIISEMSEFLVPYDQNVFTIEFAALDFTTPSKNRYEYQMVGVDPEMVERDSTKRYATYTNLNAGEHIFRVIGTNNDGIHNEEGLTIKIIIPPPLFQRTWFQIMMGCILILMLFAGYRIRTRFLREKLAEQERIQVILKKSRDEMEQARDLAELRHAENEKLLTAISSLFIAVDSEGIIFQWNTTCESFFKIPRYNAIQKPLKEVLMELIHEDKLNEILESGSTADGSSRSIEISVDLTSKKVGIRLLLCAISTIRDSGGKKLGFLILADDITNRKQAEMMKNLSKKLESLGQMASGIAHEIKTPLQYIGHNARFVSDSFNEFLKVFDIILQSDFKESEGGSETVLKLKKNIEENDLEYIMKEIPIAAEQIIGGVTRVSDIITAMNDFSHPGRGFKEKADINGLIKSTLIMVQNRIKKTADIHIELSDTLPPVSCFPNEMNQVFMNLLINASDAVLESGKWGIIKISTYREKQDVIIAVSDTGSGISEEIKDNIFNPFFTTKDVGKGTGQGLSLAHNIIVEKHKGKIYFSSRPGEGTTFYIRIPIEGEN